MAASPSRYRPQALAAGWSRPLTVAVAGVVVSSVPPTVASAVSVAREDSFLLVIRMMGIPVPVHRPRRRPLPVVGMRLSKATATRCPTGFRTPPSTLVHPPTTTGQRPSLRSGALPWGVAFSPPQRTLQGERPTFG